MPITEFLVQKTLSETANLYLLKYTWFATIHFIRSRGLVAGEHQIFYLHEQVSQQRLVFPRENHQARACSTHIPAQPSVKSTAPGLCPTYRLCPGPMALLSFCISCYMPPGHSNICVCILQKPMGTCNNLNRKICDKMFGGMTEVVSTIPRVRWGLKAILQSNSPPKIPS